ncbi:hypothetical protein GcM1_02047 [Golovinomyces cichoracearum]|uniref:Uncharacterized protein n=1 Tax=Golovinomyces cichoracearum TaxID=62708 RepID=A0A420IIR9_9PEZI|nr:hypothetical protein GcM1_02047 [Golovinomyces cichoracearum]
MLFPKATSCPDYIFSLSASLFQLLISGYSECLSLTTSTLWSIRPSTLFEVTFYQLFSTINRVAPTNLRHSWNHHTVLNRERTPWNRRPQPADKKLDKYSDEL